MLNHLLDLLYRYLPHSLETLLHSAVAIVVILAVGVALTLGVRKVFQHASRLAQQGLMQRGDTGGDRARHMQTLITVGRTALLLLIWALLGAMILDAAGVNVAPLLTGAGVLGVVLGLGAQRLVQDFIGGFVLILENHVRLGDVVRVGDSAGLVEQITYRVLVLRELDGTLRVIPHSQVHTLANLTKDWAAAVLDVGIAYRENPDRVMHVLQEEAGRLRADPQWAWRILEPLEVFGLDELADSSVVIKIRLKCLPLERWNVKRELLKRVKEAFKRERIEIPYPALTLNFAPDSAELQILAALRPPPEPSR
ncbi:MAG TPA: mechanosensitive ion channel family protein [bacterium]|nr:mechanosensitive ion channel family protein [bacterium]